MTTNTDVSAAFPKAYPKPIYARIRDFFADGGRMNWPVAIYIGLLFLALALKLTGITQTWFDHTAEQKAISWYLFIGYISLANIATTVYTHPMKAHGNAKEINPHVDFFFAYALSPLSVTGSIKDWYRHKPHHGADRALAHKFDPYSATWFPYFWMNFVWANCLAYMVIFPPEVRAKHQSIMNKAAETDWLAEGQDRNYIYLIIFWVHLFPLILGTAMHNSSFGVSLMLDFMAAASCAQLITWTVNSFAHLVGHRDAKSSARGSYWWMWPLHILSLGLGGGHDVHHRFPQDYRNCVTRMRYLPWVDISAKIIWCLEFLGLVTMKPVTPQHKVDEMLAENKLLKADSRIDKLGKSTEAFKKKHAALRAKLDDLKNQWVQARKDFDNLKADKANALAAEISNAKAKADQARKNFTSSYKNLCKQIADFPSNYAATA